MKKIIIQVKVNDDKCRAQALKIVAAADGVISLAWDGKDKDKMVVVGDGVDAANLTTNLDKNKLGPAKVLSVEEVKEKKEKPKKIVIRVRVRSNKCRSEALKIVAAADGVISLEWEGKDNDKMVVVGEGVDATNLTTKLDKKLGPAELLLLEEVKEKKEEKKAPEEKKLKEEKKAPEEKKAKEEKKAPEEKKAKEEKKAPEEKNKGKM